MSWFANSALRLPARVGALPHLRLPLFVFVAYWISANKGKRSWTWISHLLRDN